MRSRFIHYLGCGVVRALLVEKALGSERAFLAGRVKVAVSEAKPWLCHLSAVVEVLAPLGFLSHPTGDQQGAVTALWG